MTDVSLINIWTFALSLHRGSKLTMLLREALGHVNCHTTVIAQVDDSLVRLQETLSTIQLASRIRRTQKRTKVPYMFFLPIHQFEWRHSIVARSESDYFQCTPMIYALLFWMVQF